MLQSTFPEPFLLIKALVCQNEYGLLGFAKYIFYFFFAGPFLGIDTFLSAMLENLIGFLEIMWEYITIIFRTLTVVAV